MHTVIRFLRKNRFTPKKAAVHTQEQRLAAAERYPDLQLSSGVGRSNNPIERLNGVFEDLLGNKDCPSLYALVTRTFGTLGKDKVPGLSIWEKLVRSVEQRAEAPASTSSSIFHIRLQRTFFKGGQIMSHS
jgi:hypothetical protein